jgi:alpha-galactosidase
VVKKAGFNPGWSGMFYVLDFYNEEFRNYLREVFKTVFEEWDYDMVKLDFLYAAALIEREDKTKGQIMYEAMKFLRELAGDRLILGCGVPLGCSFGLVDYCRIGSDVALKWEDKLLKKLHYRERVSTINSLTSTIGRRHLNNRAFLNDPDVFIIRSKGVELDKNQRYSLLLLNLIFGGLVFTSDNLEEYSEEEMKLYKSIFPIKDKRINKVIEDEILRVYFSIDDNEYLALCNLNSEQVVIKNKDEAYFCREKGYIPKNAVVTLEPYESICLLKTENVDENLLRSNNIFMI